MEKMNQANRRFFQEVNLSGIRSVLADIGEISPRQWMYLCKDILSRKSVPRGRKEKALNILLSHRVTAITDSDIGVLGKGGSEAVSLLIARAEMEVGLEIKSGRFDPEVAKALMLRGVSVTSVHAFNSLVRSYTNLEDMLLLVGCSELGDWTYREYDWRYNGSGRKEGAIPRQEPMKQFVVSDMLSLTREALGSEQRIELVKAALRKGAVCDAPLDIREEHSDDRETPINIAASLLDFDLFRFLHGIGVNIDSGVDSFSQYKSIPSKLNYSQEAWEERNLHDLWNILQYYFTNTGNMKRALDALFDPFAKGGGEYSLFFKISTGQRETLVAICMERGSVDELEHLAGLLILRDQAELLKLLDSSGKIPIRTGEYLRQSIRAGARSVEEWLLESGVNL